MPQRMGSALLGPAVVYGVVLLLHLALPARWVDGYVHGADGRPLRYRLNGLWVFAVTLALWAGLCWAGALQWGFFYQHRWEMVSGACALGLLASALVVLTAPKVKGLLADLFLGRRENPQYFANRVDAKMYLYLAGATMLELNVLSFAAHHWQMHRDEPSLGVALFAGLFTFFLTEYLHFEEVHLYTYDFVAERIGFKLTWGCLVFYPFFYSVGLWALAEAPNPHTPVVLLALVAVLFFSGWVLSRGANLQKYWFKRDPQKKAFGLLEPRFLVSPGDRRVLISGFWGLSRHINYLGEILMAVGLALSLGHPTSVWPWLYPLYYVLLLLPRQHDDDARCAAKYGPMWAEYRQRVPSRIIPRVY